MEYADAESVEQTWLIEIPPTKSETTDPKYQVASLAVEVLVWVNNTDIVQLAKTVMTTPVRSSDSSNNIVYSFFDWNEGMKISIPILVKVSSVISLIGSTRIIHQVLHDPHGIRTNSIYNRLALCISLFDILADFGYFFASWNMPKDSFYNGLLRFNVGNMKSCEVSGLLITFGVTVVAMYTGCLIIYFLLLLRYHWSPTKISERFEPGFHCVSILYPCLISLIFYFRGFYNPMPQFCWIGKYPMQCESTEYPDLTCIRGKDTYGLKTFLALAPGFIFVFVIVISLVLILITIRTSIRKRKTSSNNGEASNPLEEHPYLSSSGENLETPKQYDDLKTMKTFRQIGMYCGSFVRVWSASMIHNKMSPNNFFLRLFPPSQAAYTIYMGSAILFPLQGILNAIAYNGYDPAAVAIRRVSSIISARLSFLSSIHGKRIRDLSSEQEETGYDVESEPRPKTNVIRS